MRKPRSDSKLAALTEAQREMLCGWIYEENLSYADVSKRCWADFALRVSPTAVRYHKEHLDQERILERVALSANAATAVEAKFNEHKAPIEGALVKMLSQLAFEMAVNGKLVDPETFCAISNLVLKAKDQDLKAQAYQLQRDKFQFDAAKACLAKLPELKAIAGDNAMNQDEKLKQIRLKLFGVLPGEGDV